MIPIYDSAAMPLSQILYRGEEEKNAEVEAATAEILRRVRMEGDAALYDYTERFDHVRLDSLRVSEEEIEAAFAAADAALLATMRQAFMPCNCARNNGWSWRMALSWGNALRPWNGWGFMCPAVPPPILPPY